MGRREETGREGSREGMGRREEMGREGSHEGMGRREGGKQGDGA